MVLADPASCPPLAAGEAGRRRRRARHPPRGRRGRGRRGRRGALVLAESFGAAPGRDEELAADLRRTLDDPRVALVLDPGRGRAGRGREGDVVRRLHLPVVDRDRARRSAAAASRRSRRATRWPSAAGRTTRSSTSACSAATRPRCGCTSASGSRRSARRRTCCSNDGCAARLTAGRPRLTGWPPTRRRARRPSVARDGGAVSILSGTRPSTSCPWQRETPSDDPAAGRPAWCSSPRPAGWRTPSPRRDGDAALRARRGRVGDGRARPRGGGARRVARRRPAGPGDDVAEPLLGATGAAAAPPTGCPAARSSCWSRRPRAGSPASLVRDGEGPCALYLRAAGRPRRVGRGGPRRGATVSAARTGPFGTGVLVPGPAVAGPHVLVVV